MQKFCKYICILFGSFCGNVNILALYILLKTKKNLQIFLCIFLLYEYAWMIPIFQNDFQYCVSNIFRIGVIISISRNFKISYNAREERVQRLSNTVFLNNFIIFYQRNFFSRHYLDRKKKLYCFLKNYVVGYLCCQNVHNILFCFA